MSSSSDKVLSVSPTTYSVPVGLTLAVFVGALAGQCSVSVRHVGGGATLTMLAANAGSTYAGATLAAIGVSGAYIFGISGTESIVNLSGPASFYLAATGATAIVSVLRGMTSGY